jgi:YVTN family beta-propeller protein
MKRLLPLVVSLALVMGFTTPSQADTTTADGTMVQVANITGGISPKSVHSHNGVVAAFNMMYRHTVTLYNANTMKLTKSISDSIKLSDFGYSQFPGTAKGAPVEGAFSPDGKYLYVTNYSMYGKGFGPEGLDSCTPADKTDRSFVYRINLATKAVDNVYYVGAVPKVISVTPDNRYVLVTNWCSWEMSVISTATQTVVKKVYIGRHPRGIAVSPNSKYAYVAEMGSANVHRIDLNTWAHIKFYVGSGVRAIVLSPDGNTLYATLNGAGKVASFDAKKRKLIKTVATGKAPRSITLSTDGTALFAVNYESGTVAKVRTSDMKVMQTIDVCKHPIGITFEATNQRTWVACYGGNIKVFSNN